MKLRGADTSPCCAPSFYVFTRAQGNTLRAMVRWALAWGMRPSVGSPKGKPYRGTFLRYKGAEVCSFAGGVSKHIERIAE